MGKIWIELENWITPVPDWLRRVFARVLTVSIVLLGVWFGFIALISHFSVSTTPALIMVWASAFVLLLAAFPRLLETLKRIKVKDFELELQDALKESPQEWITPEDLDRGELLEKSAA